MLKKWIALVLSSAFMLAACHSPIYNQTEGNVADVKLKAAQARHEQDKNAAASPSLVVKKGPYVDTRPKSLYRDPSWLNKKIIIRGDSLPFSYYSRTIAAGAGKHILVKYQPELTQSKKVSMNYSGSVRGALSLLASKTGYVYHVHSRSISWDALINKSFDIAFMPGATDYLMGKDKGGVSAASGGGANTQNFTSSDSSAAEFSSLKGTLSVWKDLEATIKEMLSPSGKVMVSESTTTVTVRDFSTNVKMISRFIKQFNKSLSKQVLVKIQVLEVNLQSDYNFGIDWGIIAKAFNNTRFILNANYGTPITLSALTSQTAISGAAAALPQGGIKPTDPSKVPAYSLLFNALNQQGKTSIVSEPRVVALNNQVSVVRIVTQEGYIASIENTTTTASGGSSSNVTSQITPGTLVYGLTLYVLPKILNNDIYLQVNADLSTKDGLTEKTSGTQTIQLPQITEKHFNQRSKIKSGDTLILAGFRQLTNKANANQFLKSQALGGKGSSALNRETVVLITPIILHGSA